MRKILFLLFFTISISPVLLAQRSGDFGVTGGTMYYLGELNPAMPFRMAKPAFGLLYRQNFNDRLAVRVHGLYGSVAGDDLVSKANPDRALNFESNITEVGTQFEINFFEYHIGSKLHPITPYIYGGGSLFFFNPKNLLGIPLAPLRTEGQIVEYKKSGLNALFGVGGKYSINKLFGLGAEWGMRKTFTDYLDDVSTTYPIINLPTSDPLMNHTTGQQRGNSRNKDWYSYAGLSLTVKIVMLKREKCLEFQKRYSRSTEKLY